jgi:uncharacterized protein (TIGR02145 family)
MIVLAACNEDSYYLESSDKQIIISGYEINSYIATRAVSDKFDDGDKLGLFVSEIKEKVAGRRYIDNEALTCSGGNLVSENAMFYPEKDSVLNFVCYYPYSDSGIQAGSSLLPISTERDQSNESDFRKSDFKLANMSVPNGSNSVSLSFSHKLSMLDISLQPSDTAINQKVIDNSNITIERVYTNACYDVLSGEISKLTAMSGITTYGTLTRGDSTLVGRKAYIIPQDMAGCRISLSIGNDNYTCDFPKDITLQSGSAYSVIIKYSVGQGIGSISASISDWVDDGTVHTTDAVRLPNLLDLTSLKFDDSPVCKVYNSKNSMLGLLCSEYLYSSDIDCRAIVYYRNGNLRHGTVVQLLDTTGYVNGGSVSWNSDNTLAYVAGERPAFTELCIDDSGEIVSGCESDNLNSCVTEPLMVVDIRGDETTKYPVQKIGRQYWMRGTLRTTMYNDGTKIADNTITPTSKSAGYYVSDGNYFYNKAALNTLKLSPKGWRIPCESDIDMLKKYIDKACKLKGGTWETNDGTPAATNATGLDVHPVGAFWEDNGKSSYCYKDRFGFAWVMNNSDMAAAKIGLAFSYSSDDIKGFSQESDLVAVSVMCLRED